MNTGCFSKQKPGRETLKDSDRFPVLMIQIPRHFIAY